MARPLSLDLRLRVAAVLGAGATTREAAKRFGISVASAVRIGQKRRSGRGLGPEKIGGYRPLVPTLTPGDIAILDNQGSHKNAAARKADLEAGAHLFFLPPYSTART